MFVCLAARRDATLLDYVYHLRIFEKGFQNWFQITRLSFSRFCFSNLNCTLSNAYFCRFFWYTVRVCRIVDCLRNVSGIYTRLVRYNGPLGEQQLWFVGCLALLR